jgi:hypothetical protein
MIKIPEINSKKIVTTIDNQCSDYRKFIPTVLQPYDGKGVKISIIGTGTPFHECYTGNHKQSQVFIEETSSDDDLHGYSTMLSGIAFGNDKKIHGIATKSQVHFIKAFDNKGQGAFQSLTASILWSAVQGLDAIFLPISKQDDYCEIHSSIKKAHELNIPVFVFLYGKLNEAKQFLSDNENAFIVLHSKEKKFNIRCKDNIIFISRPDISQTILGKNSFVNTTSQIVSFGILIGIVSLIIQKEKPQNTTPQSIYKYLSSL